MSPGLKWASVRLVMMKTSFKRRLVSFMAGLLVCGASAAWGGDASVVFWRLKSLGIDEPTAAGISKVLAGEIDGLDGVSLVPDERLQAAVDGRPGLSSCQGARECLVEVGRAAGATGVISGVLGILGDVFSLDIKLVDVVSGMEIRRVAQTWSGESDSLIEVMRQVACRLLKPEAYKGWLDIRLRRQGVHVFVDGVAAGRTPLSEPLHVSPGRHALKLSAPGFRDYSHFIDVPFGQTVTLTVDMDSLSLSGVISAEKNEDLFNIGLKLGLISNTRTLSAPQLSLEFGLRLPIWGGRLAVLFESGAWGSDEERTAFSEVTGQTKVNATILVWPIQLNLLLRLLPDYPFSPFLTAGPGFALVWQKLSPEGLAQQSFRDAAFGFQVGCGLEYRLGPGLILAEARYLHVWIDGPQSEGGMSGLVGGLGALVGYRLLL